jgi:hypothetical protein
VSESGLFKPSREEEGMSLRRKPEQIINLLREAEVALSQGETIG